VKDTLDVLVVEDNPADADLIREMLPGGGTVAFHVDTTDRLADAIAHVRRMPVDLVLLDLGLPDSQGLATLHAFRAAAPRLPIVVLTGNDDEDLAIRAVRDGAQDYLVKGQIVGHLLVRSSLYAVERVQMDEAARRQAEELRREIADRKLAEALERLGREVLESLTHSESAEDAIRNIVRAVRTTLGIEAAAVRLRDAGDFPYYVTAGFSDEFVRAEWSLCARDDQGRIQLNANGDPMLECMCGNVLAGRVDPSLPFFTSGGSFWTNSTTRMLATSTESERQAPTRNRCNRDGYESVALVPLRAQGHIIGLLQLNDHRPGQFSLSLMTFLEGLGLSIGIALARQQSATALRESEAHYRAVMESANDAVVTADIAGNIEYWNPAAERMFGYAEQEARGRPLTMVIPGRLAEAHLAGIERSRSGAGSHVMGTTLELEGVRRDGTVFPLELSLSEWATPSGRHFTGVMHDITARKRTETERRALEVQLRQAQKMESVGRLAGGVAHDFNNMLAIITGYTDLAMRRMDPSEPMQADLREVMKAARRSAEIVRHLLAFARKQTIMPKIFDLNEAVGGMLKLLRRLIGEDIDLLWQPAETVVAVKMDPTQLDQILANVAVNARDAIAGVGRVIITAGIITLDQRFCAEHPGAKPGRCARLTVSDNGCGMDAETLAQIFEPFFTTKAEGKGTGLGLSTVYGIVKQNEGFVTVDSQPGQGTTFTLYLPAHEPAAIVAGGVTDEPGDAPVGSETILLVEDEAGLLAVCQHSLEHLGYTVVATASPLQAIELFLAHPGGIDLLLTDVVMPKLNGRALYQKLDQLRPGLKCLYTSGHSADILGTRGMLDETVHFLQKPYSWQSLARKVREVLDAPVTQTPAPPSLGPLEVHP